ncbi:DNA methyltransferase [Hansschlegelia sp.]|uniref:DNA methyltransferase n=1 Tax=Hansschlegelia sp. TaxID=2041892 RepID=UPI002B8FDE7C|nr:DNA methyltransferase [Hansschlegelia sp.]HVI27095.1 DNA methyltransferase [Hansschlegelia sp.]
MNFSPTTKTIDRPIAAGDLSAQSNDLYANLNLTIEQVPIGEIKGYARSARTHSPAQIEQIKNSIRAFGFVIPITLEDDGTLIAGHGRVAAAKLLGRKTVPAVRVSHLDDAQKRALRLADNKTAENAGWDKKLLAIEFAELISIELKTDISFDLTVTGFASPEIDRLIETDDAESEQKDEDEDVPEAPEQPVARHGDVFELGDHRIICGDSTDPATYAALLDDERAVMSVSDAPYNVSIKNHVGSSRHGEFVMGVGEMTVDAFTAFLARFLSQCSAFCRPGSIHMAFMDWRHMGELLAAGSASKLELKNLCVWDKGSGGMGSLYRSQHELVFVFKEPSAPHANNVQLGKFGRNRTNVWSYPGAASLRKELELHPTPKPVALIADAIRDVSNRNDIVLDAFSGSGTTIIAAAKTGRRARVIDLDPAYVDVAIRRWEAWSGGVARHVGTGATFAELAAMRGAESGERAPEPDIDPQARAIRVRRRVPAALAAE